MSMRYRSTGFVQEVSNFENKTPKFDPRTGDHFWVVVPVYKVDPELFLNNGGFLDKENLVSISPVACFHCMQVYTPNLAKKRCKGSE